MKTHTYGIKKTTIRLTVKTPDNYAHLQQLYDYGAWFKLQRELVTDPDRITQLIEYIKSNGGRQIDENVFIDDDDLKEKQTLTYEVVINTAKSKNKIYVIKAEQWSTISYADGFDNYVEYEEIVEKYIYTNRESLEKEIETIQEEIKKDPNWSYIYTREVKDRDNPHVWAEEITIEGI